MKKRLVKMAITAALTMAVAAPVFANPFSDVPTNHWAYQAVNKLAQAGVVEGFNDGTFQGNKTVTRYEMAQIVAKAMTKNVNADQQAVINQLSKEFAVELDNLGVKVDGMQKQLDNMVKISGDARVRYFNTEDAADATDYRARITFDGKINDNMKYNARISSGNANLNGTAKAIALDTANINFKLLGLDTTVGRQDLKLGSGFLADDQMNGAKVQVGALKLFGGNATSNLDGTKYDKVYGAEYGMNVMGAKVTADYLKDVTLDNEFYGVNTSFGLVKGVTATAEYVKNDTTNAAAQAYGLKLDNYGLSATYRDVEDTAMPSMSTLNAVTSSAVLPSTGFKGMEYQYDRALDKNAALTVKYQDFEDQAGVELGARTSAVVNVKF